MSNPNKSCILYDFLYCMGGAEKTTFIMHEAFQNSKICVDFVNWDDFENLTENNILELGKPCKIQAFNAVKGMYNFKTKTRFLKNYDLVIYSGSYAPCAVHNQVKGKKVLYCHTIPRFAYDLYEHYSTNLNPVLRPFFRALVAYTRKRYEKAFSQMDLIIANSENVRSRIQKHLNSDAIVINPPVDTSAFNWLGQQDYYLSTARLEKYKRVDIIVEAFKKMPDKKLIVASGGIELDNLRKLAGGAPNITFTGWIDHNKLVDLMGNAIATIYLPKDEDFGMSPVESMAAGKPVIGANEGGIRETVIHGETGLLIKPEIQDLIQAVKTLNSTAAMQMKELCQKGHGNLIPKLSSQKYMKTAAENYSIAPFTLLSKSCVNEGSTL